ncbi:MAG: LysR family transcriptional regulator [Deltaproteobacteria bacterium]|nr:LysR family transcriptional regulator [Deltaproteobacteria bacterium]
MLNLNLLRIFYAAAKKQNFSAAAKELVITQPTVSAQIKALEKQYGVILFKRIGKKVELTDSGRRLLGYAKRVFDLATEIEELLNDICKREECIIRLGIGKSYGKYFISPLLSQFQKKIPKVKIILKEGNSSEGIYKYILRYEIDFGLLGGINFIKKRGLELIKIDNQEVLLMVWPHHRLANRKSVCFSDLEDEPIVLREKGSAVRELILARFEQEKIKPNIVIETENVSTLIELIKKEEGIGFLSKFIAEEEMKDGTLKAISLSGKTYLGGYLAFLKNSYFSQTKKAFLKVLVEYISQGPYANFLDLKTISRFM